MGVKKINADDIKVGMKIAYYRDANPILTNFYEVKSTGDVRTLRNNADLNFYDVTEHGFKTGDYYYMSEEGWNYHCNPDSRHYLGHLYLDKPYRIEDTSNGNVLIEFEFGQTYWVPMYLMTKEPSVTEFNVDPNKVVKTFDVGPYETVDVDKIYNAESFEDLGMTEQEVLHQLLTINSFAQRMYMDYEKRYLKAKYKGKYQQFENIENEELNIEETVDEAEEPIETSWGHVYKDEAYKNITRKYVVPETKETGGKKRRSRGGTTFLAGEIEQAGSAVNAYKEYLMTIGAYTEEQLTKDDVDRLMEEHYAKQANDILEEDVPDGF